MVAHPRRQVLGAMAAAGVVLAHGLAYLVAFPNPQRRAAVLGDTGHGYWSVAVALAAVLGLLVLAWVIARPLAHRVAGETGPPDSPVGGAGALGALAAGQVGMFLVVEIVERLVAGTSVAEIWHRPEFALGIVLQVVVAVAAYALLRAVDRLARGLAKSRSIVVAPRRVTNIVVSLDVFQTSRVGRPGAARAPPLSAAR